MPYGKSGVMWQCSPGSCSQGAALPSCFHMARVVLQAAGECCSQFAEENQEVILRVD